MSPGQTVTSSYYIEHILEKDVKPMMKRGKSETITGKNVLTRDHLPTGLSNSKYLSFGTAMV